MQLPSPFPALCERLPLYTTPTTCSFFDAHSSGCSGGTAAAVVAAAAAAVGGGSGGCSGGGSGGCSGGGSRFRRPARDGRRRGRG